MMTVKCQRGSLYQLPDEVKMSLFEKPLCLRLCNRCVYICVFEYLYKKQTERERKRMCVVTPSIPAAPFEFLGLVILACTKCLSADYPPERERLTLSWLRSARMTKRRVMKWQTVERGYSYIDAKMKRSQLRQKQQHESTVTGHATHNYTVTKMWVHFFFLFVTNTWKNCPVVVFDLRFFFQEGLKKENPHNILAIKPWKHIKLRFFFWRYIKNRRIPSNTVHFHGAGCTKTFIFSIALFLTKPENDYWKNWTAC